MPANNTRTNRGGVRYRFPDPPIFSKEKTKVFLDRAAMAQMKLQHQDQDDGEEGSF
ncbi:MAG: hypothetical protein HRT35_30935 [Algicola sp.]|nr:hypothetical protein [Algicola sp.]